MVTDLERLIWAAAEPLRATRFAAVLQNARRSDGDALLPSPDGALQGMELSFDPAIQRTLGGAVLESIVHGTPPRVDDEWYRWNLAAKKAVTRFAAKCWAGIDADRRRVFIDTDNLQPIFGQDTLFDLRMDTPGPHLFFEGLSDEHARAALRAVYEAARATPAYETALHADRRLDRSRELLLAWALLAQTTTDELRAQNGLTIEEAKSRSLQIVKRAYEGTPVEEIAQAFRRYNRLVQHIVWSILGLAEMIPSTLVVTDPVGTMRSTRDADGSPFIRLTSSDASKVFLRPTHPVWLATGTPLDGLHIVVGYTFHFAGGASCDLSLIPIRWSAGMWP